MIIDPYHYPLRFSIAWTTLLETLSEGRYIVTMPFKPDAMLGDNNTNRKSLNDIQYIGPKIQKDLLDTVRNFRMGQIAFSADIVKMYRQIRVKHTQWDLQRILWRENSNEPIEEYWLITVTYG